MICYAMLKPPTPLPTFRVAPGIGTPEVHDVFLESRDVLDAIFRKKKKTFPTKLISSTFGVLI